MSEPAAPTHEASHALRNALKLAGSLIVSFGITLAVRHFLVPRVLGAERLGELNFADGFSGLFLVSAWMGVDTWLRTELGTTLKRADGIFGGVVLVRLGLGFLLTTAMVATLLVLGRPTEIVLTAVVFAVAQLVVMTQNTASALLHTAGKVDGLSIVNILAKLTWAVGIVAGLFFHVSIVWLAVSFALAESVRTAGTLWLCRRHVGLTAEVDWPATRNAIKVSVAWWVNAIALAGMGRADVAVLGSVAAAQLGSQAAANREVGWYTAVLGFGGVLMSVVPVISWVLLPLLSKAAKESPEKAGPIIRRALEACVVIGAPLAVGAYAAAEQLVLLLKPEFLPAARVLEVISVTYFLTYVNVVAAICLSALGRGWTVTLVSIAMLGVAPALDFVFVPMALQHFGPSAGSVTCAASVVVVEVVTTGLMLYRLGRMALDARLASVLLRTLLTAGIVLAIDFGLRRTGLPGWPRVGLVAVLWVGVALLTRSVRIADVKAVVQLARAQRAARAA